VGVAALESVFVGALKRIRARLMKRLQAIVIESEVVTELEALGLGHECLLKDAKPSSSQVRQVIK
jgi:hypothetical protein